MKFIKKFNLYKKFVPSQFFWVVTFSAILTSILFYINFIYLYQNPKQPETILVIKNSSIESPVEDDTSSQTQITKQIEEWGIARQISESTWTMNVGEDEFMTEVSELYEALNNYRNKKGVGSLSWNDKLTELAEYRVDTFISIGKLDEHAGFSAYVENEENMKNLGFWGVGENSSYGFRMSGVHLIEWIFAGDPPHENNQLDPSWTHVGIAVKQTAVDIIFGKK